MMAFGRVRNVANEGQNVYFSIIVPVYNVQDYLTQCVQSVLDQTYTDFEIILVDDGSVDDSGKLCDYFAEKDSRVVVIHQVNQGLSGARNSGLAKARGRYILFLDSDDFYPQETFLEEIARNGGEKEVICFNYARYFKELQATLIDFQEISGSTAGTLLLEMVKKNAYISSACVKAVKRSLLLENEIIFEVGTISEDIEWSAKVMCAAKNVAISPNAIYAYRVREGSISKAVSWKHVSDQLRILNKLIETKPEGEKMLVEAYYGYTAFQYCTILINARLCRPQLPREKWEEIRQLSWLLQHDTNRIVKLIRMVHSVLGLKITSWLLLVYFKLFCS